MYISRLHFITDNPLLADRAIQGGADWVQLRLKKANAEIWSAFAQQAKNICSVQGATLIINDHVEMAKTVAAAGVHLGSEDMPPDQARKLLGPGFIIGGTANTIGDIRRLAALNVDYIGLGPFRFTPTKSKLSPLLALDGYRQVLQQCRAEGIRTPVLAIGGITVEDIDDLMQTGIHGIAVSAAIAMAADITATTRVFVQKLKTYNHE